MFLTIIEHFSYKTDDKQEKQEEGFFNEKNIWTMKGFYSYIDDNGKTYKVRWEADDKGFFSVVDLLGDRGADYTSEISRNAIITLLG